MAKIQRFRRRVLTFLISLIGGSTILSGPLVPEARAYERGDPTLDAKKYDTIRVIPMPPDPRVYQQPTDSRMKFTPDARVSTQTPAGNIPVELLQRDIVMQQQEILLKVEELKQMLDALQLKLNSLQEGQGQN